MFSVFGDLFDIPVLGIWLLVLWCMFLVFGLQRLVIQLWSPAILLVSLILGFQHSVFGLGSGIQAFGSWSCVPTAYVLGFMFTALCFLVIGSLVHWSGISTSQRDDLCLHAGS